MHYTFPNSQNPSKSVIIRKTKEIPGFLYKLSPKTVNGRRRDKWG